MQRFRSNQYNVTVAAGGVITGASPNNPNRNYLRIQNNGINAGRVQFGRPANNSSDIELGAGDSIIYEQMIPTDSINFYSILGTSFAIQEGNPV